MRIERVLRTSELGLGVFTSSPLIPFKLLKLWVCTFGHDHIRFIGSVEVYEVSILKHRCQTMLNFRAAVS